ncbi:unnamed protein product [Rangifer tarandus platyrhynchus]|uniref:Uncharacterized protein n=2 Tax=Rangifer tarandus platyrhynchus TaxID=3082113 RepID=A0ABN8YPY2_RANTA|nr:unnamed protein product [Rangifer tarandus platyrhynchus]
MRTYASLLDVLEAMPQSGGSFPDSTGRRQRPAIPKGKASEESQVLTPAELSSVTDSQPFIPHRLPASEFLGGSIKIHYVNTSPHTSGSDAVDPGAGNPEPRVCSSHFTGRETGLVELEDFNEVLQLVLPLTKQG